MAGLAKAGGLLSLSDTFRSGIPDALPTLVFDAAQAMDRVALARAGAVGALIDTPPDAADASRKQILESPAAQGDVHAFLTWLVAAGQARLCWRLSWTDTQGITFATYIDAVTGDEREHRKLTLDACGLAHPGRPHVEGVCRAAPQAALSSADGLILPTLDPVPAPAPAAPQKAQAVTPFSMKVFAFPNESPKPQMPLTGTEPSSSISQSTITQAVVDATASPNGWIESTYTKGNNVDAYLDTAPDNSASNSDRVQGTGSPLAFDFTIDLTTAPSGSDYRKGAVVNCFYWSNWFHDVMHGYGFDEASRNFQSNNFGRGGTGGDRVLAEVQDGGGTNNANFSPDVDGNPGRMQMYVWTAPTPDRDGDLDATIVIHELTHGLSNRLAGGGDISLSGAQAGGMGEGWSDFLAIALLSQAGQPLNGRYGVGAYATQNYSRGIRAVPYSTDTAYNNYKLGGNPGPHRSAGAPHRHLLVHHALGDALRLGAEARLRSGQPHRHSTGDRRPQADALATDLHRGARCHPHGRPGDQ